MNENDLTINFNDSVLNIRVLLLIKTPDGYIFEQHEDGYVFAIGGRIKLNESSEEAAYRELSEEINLTDTKLQLVGIIENFFSIKDKKCHEINFVYSGEILDTIDLNKFHSDHSGYVYININKTEEFDIKPKAILKIFNSKDVFHHIVNRD